MSKNNFKTFFHSIHCLLRDGELGLTGLNALNEINNFVLLVFMEQKVDEYELSEKTKFSYLCNKYLDKYTKERINALKDELVADILVWYREMLEEVFNNTNTKKYFVSDVSNISAFYAYTHNKEITDGEDGTDINSVNNVCKNLVDCLIQCRTFFYKNKKITKELVDKTFNNIDYDILGDAYEKFKEDEVGNQGKGAGQYFTPRNIIRWMIEDIKPTYKDKCYDSSCGTGGFIHYLSKFVHQN